MKTKLIAIVLTLLCVSGTLTTGRPLSVKQPHPGPQSFSISKYGTLLEVFDANGGSRFGNLNLDGYSVSYKTDGEEKTVSATGETEGRGLLPGDVIYYGQSASVTVTTDDGALEISNRFILDKITKKLVISRSIRNNSDQSSSLINTEHHLDPRLMGFRSSFVPERLNSDRKQFREEAKRRVTVKGCRDLDSQTVARPPHDPPCNTPICFLDNNFRAYLHPVSKLGSISLEWKCKKDLTPNIRPIPKPGPDNVIKKADFVVGVDLDPHR